MKRTRVFICVIALAFSLCGCSDNATHETESTNSSIHETVGNSGEEEKDTDDETVDDMVDDETQDNVESVAESETEDSESIIPEDAKDGDVLEGGAIYFEKVIVDRAEDIKNILDKYGNGKKAITFITPEYSGIIERTEDSYFIYKHTDEFNESVNYLDIGIVNTTRNEYEDGKLVFSQTKSTEADYYVDVYYEENTERHEFIGYDGKLREMKTYETDYQYRVLIYVKYNGGEQWFEYVDKANKVLSSMRVSEDNGMDYTFIFDGRGNTEVNVVSMTLTRNGSTTNYTKDEIPWQIGFVTPPGRLIRN